MKLGFIDWVLIGSGIAIVITFTIIEVTKYKVKLKAILKKSSDTELAITKEELEKENNRRNKK